MNPWIWAAIIMYSGTSALAFLTQAAQGEVELQEAAAVAVLWPLFMGRALVRGFRKAWSE